MKRAMITIEVLVALLILFLVIAASTNSIKFFQMVNGKKNNIENEYMIVLNVRDILAHQICSHSQRAEGSFDNYTYTATCEKQKEIRSYQKGFDIGDPSGNIGNYLMDLYKVHLEIKKANFDKQYIYYITNGEKLN